MLLRKGRIIIATPDVWHAWMLPSLDLPEVRKVLSNIRLTVIEEAQLYSGGFGTHMMFLLRRHQIIQRWLNPDFKAEVHGRMIATSATLSNAPDFMLRLTGQSFTEIGEEHNGAPTHPRLVAVSQNIDYGAAVGISRDFAQKYPDKKLLLFCDSRTAVEEIAEQLGDRAIPVKSGLTADFQRQMFESIRTGKANIVVATSAFEVGVDMDFDMVVNLGLPANLGSAMQRLGRGGRHGPGFILFADPANQLREYGSTQGYLTSGYPDQLLYPKNDCIQMVHAMCLRHERKKIVEALSPDVWAKTSKFRGVIWPQGFADTARMLETDFKTWPWHLRNLIPPHGLTPHRFHTLRNIGGISWRLATWSPEKKAYDNIGSTTALHAFREYQPGLIVRHMKKRWRVYKWTTDRWGTPLVVMGRYEGPNFTKGRVVNFGQISAQGKNLLSEKISTDGDVLEPSLMLECRFRLNVGIYGFNETYKTPEDAWRTKYVRYNDDEDLAEKNPDTYDEGISDFGPKRRMLIDTTGIIIHLPHHRFGSDARDWLGHIITAEYCDMMNIDRNDVAHLFERLRFIGRDGQREDNRVLVIYDRIAGSLRLTRRLPQVLKRVVNRLVDRETAEYKKAEDVYQKLQNRTGTFPPSAYHLNLLTWFRDALDAMKPMEAAAFDKKYDVVEAAEQALVAATQNPLPEGYVRVMSPGARADWVKNGVAIRVRIVQPRVYEGCPVYEVLSIDRNAFFRQARARRIEKRDTFGFVSDELPAYLPLETVESTRAIPASDLVLTAGRWIGFNPETQKYIELSDDGATEDISIAIEDRMAEIRKKMEVLREKKRLRDAEDAAKKVARLEKSAKRENAQARAEAAKKRQKEAAERTEKAKKAKIKSPLPTVTTKPRKPNLS